MSFKILGKRFQPEDSPKDASNQEKKRKIELRNMSKVPNLSAQQLGNISPVEENNENLLQGFNIRQVPDARKSVLPNLDNAIRELKNLKDSPNFKEILISYLQSTPILEYYPLATIKIKFSVAFGADKKKVLDVLNDPPLYL